MSWPEKMRHVDEGLRGELRQGFWTYGQHLMSANLFDSNMIGPEFAVLRFVGSDRKHLVMNVRRHRILFYHRRRMDPLRLARSAAEKSPGSVRFSIPENRRVKRRSATGL